MRCKDMSAEITAWMKTKPKIFCKCGCGKQLKIRRKHFKCPPVYATGHSPKCFRWKRGMWKLGEHHNWRGGKYKNKSGYLIVFKEQDKKGYTVYEQEHRLIMEKYLGRKLKRWELVHHINGVRDDNRLENLKVVTLSNHRGDVTCPKCKFIFSIH